MKKLWITAAVFVALFFTVACARKQPNSPEETSATTPPPNIVLPQISETQIRHLFEFGRTALQQTHASANKLHTAVDVFLSSPSETTLQTAQSAWRQVALSYRRFYLFRHLGLVEPEQFSHLNRLDYQISGYPIQPGFLDAFGEYKYSGLVHDVSFPITPESLAHQHGLTDLADIVLGIHAIEFLLFNVEQKREIKDFIRVSSLSAEMRERGFEKTVEVPNNRRRDLLSQQSKILNSDLQKLIAHWQEKKSGSAQSILLDLSIHRQIDSIERAMESALTNTMIEIGEFTQNPSDGKQISPQIQSAKFSAKQAYIEAALTSILQGNALTISKAKPAVAISLNKAIELTKHKTVAEGKTETDHWREVFAAVKNASDQLVDKS